MAHIALLILAIVLFPHDVFAHGVGGSGFMAGVKHPVLGLDHLLAMVSVGILSAQMGGRAIWLVPASFVLIMAVGGYAGMQSYSFLDINSIITVIEQGIIISVILLGLAIAFDKNFPVWMGMAACGFFGFFHGFAHGVEIPDAMHSLPYIAGFMVGTAGLHLVGVGIGEGAKKPTNGLAVLRYAGAAIFGMGVHMEYETLALMYGYY